MVDRVISGTRTRGVDLGTGDSLLVRASGEIVVPGTGYAVDGVGDAISVTVVGLVEARSGAGVVLQGTEVSLSVSVGAEVRSPGVAPTEPGPLGGVFAAVLAGERFDLVNFGEIVGGDGVDLSGLNGNGENAGLIEALGDFEGAGIGLRLQGAGASFSNGGTIRSVDLGVLLDGSVSDAMRFDNAGLISGPDAVVINGGSGHRFVNSGTVQGGSGASAGEGAAFRVISQGFRLDNTGTIEGDIVAGDGRQIIRNDGNIGGDIFLGAGDDRFLGTGSMGNAPGQTNNGVHAGGGNDQVFGGDGGNFLSGMGGNDWIEGGAVGDRLEGGSGNDLIEGKGGWDKLFGGKGADVFRFEGEHGTDRIADFVQQEDRLDLSSMGFDGEGFDGPFQDMLAVIRVVAGWGGIVLDLGNAGGGRVVLQGIDDPALLTAEDFIL